MSSALALPWVSVRTAIPSAIALFIIALLQRVRLWRIKGRSMKQSLGVHHSDGEYDNCKCLMRERERNRHLLEQRDDTEASLHRHRPGQNNSAVKGVPRSPGVTRVQYCQHPDRNWSQVSMRGSHTTHGHRSRQAG